jgi:WD40 repeat protein
MNVCRMAILFLASCGFGFCDIYVKAMESELSRDTRNRRSTHRDSEQVVPRIFAPIHISQEYRRGMDLIHSLMRDGETEAAISSQLDALPLQDQCEVVAAAEHVRFDWVLKVACNSYACTLASDRYLKLLLDDPITAQCFLNTVPRVAGLIRPLLHKRVNNLISRLSSASSRDTIHLNCSTVEPDKRYDVFMVPTCSLNDVVYIVRDYKGTFSDRRSSGPIVPLIMARESVPDVTVIDQEQIAQAIRQFDGSTIPDSFCGFFNGLTYKGSSDGSLIVGLTGSAQQNTNVLVVMKRIQGNSIAVTKVLKLPTPVLASVHTLSQRIFRHVPLVNITYDMNGSFMMRPDSYLVAYIGTDRDIHILDLCSTRSSRVTNFGSVSSIAWSSDGKILAYALSDGTLYLNDFTLKSRKCFKYDGEIRKVQWSIDNTKIMLTLTTEIELINAADGSKISTFALPDKIVQAVLSDDGTKILIGCMNQTTYLLDVNTMTCHHTCKIDHVGIVSLMLSPDNRYALISCVDNGAMHTYTWDLERQCLEFCHEDTVVAFSLLARKMQQGRADFHNLTMAQLVLLLAAERFQDDKTSAVTQNNPLYMHIARSVPVLRKYIIDRLLVR